MTQTPNMDSVLSTADFVCGTANVKAQYGIRDVHPTMQHRDYILRVLHKAWYRDEP